MLDNQNQIRLIDRSDMLGIISNFSHLVESGYESANSLEADFGYCEGGLVFLGLGGSAIGGDIIRDWIGPQIPNGVRIERGFELSAPIASDSLVICCSYSGNTRETISMLEQVLGSKHRNVLLISSDGKLKEIAKRKKLRFVQLESGMPPRTTLPAVVSAISVISDSIGWTKKASSEILAAADACDVFIRKNLGRDVPETKNIAKQLAHQLHGFIPVAIAPNCMTSVARRWKTQMNENAKQHCFFGIFPEISHNEIVPWQRDARSDALVALLLKGAGLNEELEQGFLRLENLLRGSARTISISPVGKSKIEILLNHVLIADFTSTYSAILSRVDPTPVEEIERFKHENK
jgi:glucose/mannose-6-phosphate isomerase